MNGVWCLVVTATLASCVSAQNGRGPPHHDNNRHGWDIRIAVPGNPGNDYPTLSNIPRTSFSCAGRETGYYADFETNCQVFRVCTVGSTYGFQSFLCPNGTLFNQAVYVCDWWMNVNCRESEQLVNIKNEQFQNLRLGPELMKDVKKMLTYPMRNPYDPKSMRNSPIIMQDYKPPAGQLFPNEALLAGPERPPSNVYVPKQNLIQNIQSNNEHYYSATTYQPKYPNQYTTSRPRDTEVFQRQRQTTPKFSARFQEEPNLRSGNSVSNTHAGQFNQYTKSESSNYRNSQPQRPLQDNNYQKNSQYFQKQTIKPTTQAPNIPTTPRKQRGKQRALHIGTRKPTISNEKQITSVTNQKYNQHLTNNYQQDTPQRYNQQITSNYQQETQQKYNQQVNNNNNQETQQKYNHQINNKNQQETQQKYNQQAISNIQRETQPIIPIKNNNLQFLKDIQFDSTLPEEVQNEVKENVVSKLDTAASTVVTNTVPFTKPVEHRYPGKAKSRVVIKTWLVKPTKFAKLIASPTPYTYERPTQTVNDNLIENSTPYVYEHPTKEPLTESTPEAQPTAYIYPRPSTTTERPTTTRLELQNIQTSVPNPPPTISERLDIGPTTALPTATSRVYLAPTTFKPAARIYLPPSNPAPSRQYLSPIIQPPKYQSSAQLRYPSSTAPTINFPNKSASVPSIFTATPSPSPVSRSRNLTFSDIFTKEKLDSTVNNIVKDTKDILKTASPPKFGQYQEFKPNENSEDNFLTTEVVTDSGEMLTSQIPIAATKPSKIIAQPSPKLEPPPVTDNILNTKSSPNIPYFQESILPPANTIERTVTIRITVPEKVASYLFKNGSNTDYDKLEILDTGSSNYLVLSNNLASTNANFIPIGKIGGNKNSNISNSQALVFSLLADSINAAKEYTNIAQQEVLPATPDTSQFQSINNAELAHITNMISKLTSTQYADIYNQNTNIIPTSQNIPANIQQYQQSGNVQSNIPLSQQIQRPLTLQSQSQQQLPLLQSQQQQHSLQLQNRVPNANILTRNGNQIYSGQLYQFSVPEVTNQIYNQPYTSSFIQPSNTPQQISSNFIQQNAHQGNFPPNLISPQQQYLHNSNLLPSGNQNNDITNLLNQPPAGVEILQSQTVPFSAAKLQIGSQPTQTFNQETIANLLNGNNGISAHLHDKIIGTIKHPLESDKLVTYEKDQSYFFTSNLNENPSLPNGSGRLLQPTPTTGTRLSNENFPDSLSLQFIPTNGYEVENERQQQQLLNAFQIDEFGAPREIQSNTAQNNNDEQVLTSNIDISIEHPPLARQVQGTNSISALYSGPSSYSAPQASVVGRRIDEPNPYSSKLEDLDENNDNGYPRTRPARQFNY